MMLITVGDEYYPDHTVLIEDKEEIGQHFLFVKQNFPDKKVRLWSPQPIKIQLNGAEIECEYL